MRSAAVACVCFVCLVLLGSPARQAAAATSGPPLTAKLVSFPPWMGPTSDVTATISVGNNGAFPLTGLSIHIEGFQGPQNRSDLANQFAGKGLRPAIGEWGDTKAYRGETLAPGENRLFTFNLTSPLSSYSFFTADRAPSAYPVQFTVAATGVPPVTLGTQLIYFQPQGLPQPLQLSVIIPLDTPTVFNAQDQETSRALEAALKPGGRINRILAALLSPDLAGAPVTLAPTGKFVDSLVLMAAPQGFVRHVGTKMQNVPPTDPAATNALATIGMLQHLATVASVRFINTPYSGAPLPALATNGLSAAVAAQVQDGASTVKSVLAPNSPNLLPGWLLPTDGLVDDSTFEQLVSLGTANMVLSPSSLLPGTPPRLTPEAPVQASSRGSVAGALVQDPVLTSRLVGPSLLSGTQILQQFLAESTTITLEQPSTPRSIAVLLPANWDPDPAVVNGLLSAIAPGTHVPWLAGATPDTIMANQVKLASRTITDNASGAEPPTPPKEYFDALRTARERLGNFLDLAPPAEMADNLTRRLLVAEGGEWWDRNGAPQRGEAFARWVTNRVNTEFSRIQVRNQTITVTSSRAAIPLGIDSRVTYPVQVVIRLGSEKLRVLHGQSCSAVPPITATCLPKTLLPGTQFILIQTAANFSGRFPVQVDLQTPNNVTIAKGRLLIRSTAYNVVALSIVGAAGVFILASWIAGILRRRVRSAPGMSPSELVEAPPLSGSPQ